MSKRPTGSGARGDTPSLSWKFYEQLLFLFDVCTPRVMKINIPTPISSQADPADVNNESAEQDMVASDNAIAPDEDNNSNTETQTSECIVEIYVLLRINNKSRHVSNDTQLPVVSYKQQ
ncbi:hypothetical protein JTB14_017110 [Gonioctena quinquepunctata]|nr:hypothetical protein JTB14_017110 [Gonioctena quinquepunctata]